MKKHYGIPYMGSKDKIVEPMIEYILSRHPNKKYFIDAFCGGFAVSQYVLENSKMIVYSNDKWSGLIEFYQKILIENKFNEIREKYIYNWVSRERFNEIIEKLPENNFLDALLTTIWSFGNNPSKSYLFGKDLEIQKELLHNLVVFNRDEISEDEETLDKEVKEQIKEIRNFYYNYLPENIKKIDYKTDKIFSNKNKRLFFMQYWKKYIKNNKLQNLDRVQQLEQLGRLERLEQLQQLQNLGRLEYLGCTKKSNRLNLSNKDVFDFLNSIPEEILKDSIVYLDPPYDSTASYDGKNKATTGLKQPLEKWCIDHKEICPIYMSEYSKENSVLTSVFFQMKHQNWGGGCGKLKKERLLFNDYAKVELTMADMLNMFEEKEDK